MVITSLKCKDPDADPYQSEKPDRIKMVWILNTAFRRIFDIFGLICSLIKGGKGVTLIDTCTEFGILNRY
jgi:hypothetical protein